MNRQEHYRQRYRELRPAWRDSLTLFRELAESLACPSTRLLDLGCGHSDFLSELYQRAGYVCGVDPDRQALRKNVTLRDRSAGLAERLPFADGSFDLIVSAWVLEHLDEP